MSEAGEANIEIARHLGEPRARSRIGVRRRIELLEIFEAIVLAVVSVTTAWSGYQAARWDGRQNFLYGRATRLRIEAQGAATLGSQFQMYDRLTVDEWLKARAHGDSRLAEQSEKLNGEATQAFEQGTQARERADQYVRATVSLATVLFLAALSQRFRTTQIRASLIILAFLILLGPLWRVLTLARL